MNLFFVFLGITVLFFVFLGVKELFDKKKEKICSICFAVSFVWIVLLVLFWVGIFDDKTILALLMGQSSLGIFYLWEKKVKERAKVFRLPLLLSLVLIAYILIEGFVFGYNVFIFIGALWILFLGIYVYGSEGKAGGFARKIVECCKKW